LVAFQVRLLTGTVVLLHSSATVLYCSLSLKREMKTKPPQKNTMTEFVIEDIEEHRTSKEGETEFFIKWEGYGPEENTWEVRRRRRRVERGREDRALAVLLSVLLRCAPRKGNRIFW
jgi:hypothetical protein